MVLWNKLAVIPRLSPASDRLLAATFFASGRHFVIRLVLSCLLSAVLRIVITDAE